MGPIKSKIVFEQQGEGDCLCYKVIALSNRTRPLIGEVLTEKDVQYLQINGEHLTIEIKPCK